jgi:chromosome segregation ATPase
MNDKDEAVEIALLEQRVKQLELIALKTEPMLAQILAAVEALKLMLSHANENHKQLSDRVTDHETRLRAAETKISTIGDHEDRLRKLEKADNEIWYIKPMSYSLFIGILGAVATATWKFMVH